MSAHKSDDFVADVERQFEWYAINAGWEMAEHYLDAVEATCHLLEQHPKLGSSSWLFSSASKRVALYHRISAIPKARSVLRSGRRGRITAPRNARTNGFAAAST